MLKDLTRTLFSFRTLATAMAAAFVIGWIMGAVTGAGVMIRIKDGEIVSLRLVFEQEKSAAIAAALDQERRAAAITSKIGGESAQKQETIRTVFRDIVRKVPVYVTREVDDRYPVPAGAIRVLNAAAAGADLPEVPQSAGEPDGGAEGVQADPDAPRLRGPVE